MSGQRDRVGSYVIQHHTGAGDDHFDLMLQHGGVLWTWRIDRPLHPADCPVNALRIADHRLAYLTYQGEIHQGRLGACRIVARGRLRWLPCSEGELAVELVDGLAAGRYRLSPEAGGENQWTIRLACPSRSCPDPDRGAGDEPAEPRP